MTETSFGDTHTSKETVADWLSYCREVTTAWCEKHQSERKLGGEGVVVEIHETKIGKRKYNRGRLFEGSWIIGMVEIIPGDVPLRGGEFRMEICPDNCRNADTLLPIIKKHVDIGTIICYGEHIPG